MYMFVCACMCVSIFACVRKCVYVCVYVSEGVVLANTLFDEQNKATDWNVFETLHSWFSWVMFSLLWCVCDFLSFLLH